MLHRATRRLLAAMIAAPCLVTAAWAADLSGDGGDATAGAVQAMQQRILSDPQAVNAVQALRDDPDVQAVLTDPAITKALASGDLAALMHDPKIQRLVDKPAVQDLTRQVGE